MKQQLITTSTADILVVELPEGAINPIISMGYITARIPNHEYGIPTHDLWDYKKNEEYMAKYDPSKEYDDWAKNLDVDGNWKLLGRLPDITEDQKCEILDIEFCDLCTLEKKGVYGTDGGYMAGCEGSRCDDTWEAVYIEFESLLQSNGILFENILGKEPDITAAETDDISDWILAQQQVWDKELTHLFIKQK